jgi:hypothetical protein
VVLIALVRAYQGVHRSNPNSPRRNPWLV